MKKIAYLPGLLIMAALIVIGAGVRPDVPVEKLKAKYANGQSNVAKRPFSHQWTRAYSFPVFRYSSTYTLMALRIIQSMVT